MNPAYPLAFLVGLLSALHCIGMCGGIVGAVSYSLPATIRRQPGRYLAYLLAFNLGRIGSYSIAGAMFGGLGAGLMGIESMGWLAEGMRLAAAGILVGIGLYIGGWFPRFAAIERLGTPLWRRLEPLGRRLLPVTSQHAALLMGVVWGWIPCGLVYSMLISTPMRGSAVSGALYMALFGAGSLPVLVATGLFAGRLNVWGRDRRFQSLSGLVLIAMALFTFYYQTYNGPLGAMP